MPVISVDSDELLELTRADEITLLDILPKLAMEIEAIEEDSWDIEVFPDRCDMLSVEGISRAVKGFTGEETGLVEYQTEESDVETQVEPSVEDVRPYIVTAIIKDVNLNERVVQSLMELQEKLHLTLGRNREKVAIGVHDFERIEPPFTYKAVEPGSVSFQPLEKRAEMNLKDILKRHEKGEEFAFILEDKERYPLIVDSNENVLSFPPIINGELTQVTEETTDLFIDMTGTDKTTLEQTLNILCTMLADRGAEVHNTEVRYLKDDEIHTYPDLSTSKMEISVEECRDILGKDLSSEDIVEALEKTRYSGKILGDEEDRIEVTIPPYRHDIIHPWDIMEDIAIGFDFDRFEGELPRQVTFGKREELDDIKENISQLLTGYGFLEVMNYSLSSPKREYDKMNIDKEGEELSRIANPVTEDNTCLRPHLLPSLMSNLRENRNKPLPQKLFELGEVVRNGEQTTKLGAVLKDLEAGFSSMKSKVKGILSQLDVEAKFEAKSHPSFIKGRCAAIVVKDGDTDEEVELGYYGEVHPKVLDSFELEYPVTALEMNVYSLYELKESIEG